MCIGSIAVMGEDVVRRVEQLKKAVADQENSSNAKMNN